MESQRDLETLGPVAGLALGVRYGNNLNLARQFAIDERKWIAVEHNPASPVKIERKEPRLHTHFLDGSEQLFIKAIRYLLTAYQLKASPSSSVALGW